jgi:hypothetical protein
MLYKCVKDFAMDTGEIAFTQGKFYEGQTSATPGGEWAMSFTDDTGHEHLMMGRALREHLEPVDPGRAAIAAFLEDMEGEG